MTDDELNAFIREAWLKKHERKRPMQKKMVERYDAIVKLVMERGAQSVRQVDYGAVGTGIPGIPKDENGYAKIQRALKELRWTGRIPWEMIIDSTRATIHPLRFEDVEHALSWVSGYYRERMWLDSIYHLEVWVESRSIAQQVAGVCSKWDVALQPCGGQPGDSFLKRQADNWRSIAEEWRDYGGKKFVVFYIGDLDPSGLLIEESAKEKLQILSGGQVTDLTWIRLGVTWEQVEQYDLIGTPPKLRKSEEFTDEEAGDALADYPYPMAVEAEALDPRVWSQWLDEAIDSYAHPGMLENNREATKAGQAKLKAIAESYDDDEGGE